MLFLSKWKVQIVVFLVTCAIFAVLALTARHFYKAYLGKVGEVASLQTSLAEATSAGKLCSDSVDAAKKESDAREAKAKEDVAAAAEKAKVHEKKAIQILANPVEITKEECSKGDAMINEYLEGLKQ